MLRPTPGELIEGVRRELKDTVLPAIPPGAAARQLRAAIHVLGQLASTWDRQHRYLAADNDDLDRSLANLAELTGIPRDEVFAQDGADIPGISDPALADLARANLALQAELESLQRRWRVSQRDDAAVDEILARLHVRMTARAAHAAGVEYG
jgi:hypothetical protein